jgi:hypothetical protein
VNANPRLWSDLVLLSLEFPEILVLHFDARAIPIAPSGIQSNFSSHPIDKLLRAGESDDNIITQIHLVNLWNPSSQHLHGPGANLRLAARLGLATSLSRIHVPTVLRSWTVPEVRTAILACPGILRPEGFITGSKRFQVLLAELSYVRIIRIIVLIGDQARICIASAPAIYVSSCILNEP